MSCGGCASCKPARPAWVGTRGNGSIVGVCPATSLEQCNGVFTSDTVGINAGAPTLPITFDVSTSNFERFRPQGIRFHVTDLAGLIHEDLERDVGFTNIQFQGTNYKLDANTTALSAFSIYGFHALSLIELGDLVPGGQDVTVTLNLIATGSASTYQCQGIMYGWAVRGGGTAGSAIVP